MEKLDIFAKDCPARFPLQVISGKWGLLVILALEKKPLRFSELVHNIGGISERMASQTLKYLEQIGVVRREVLQRSKPPQVYYELTSLGRRFLNFIASHRREKDMLTLEVSPLASWRERASQLAMLVQSWRWYD